MTHAGISDAISIRPYQLLCLRCLNGDGELPVAGAKELVEILNRIKHDPEVNLRLDTAFNNIGATSPIFPQTSHIDRKRDLDVLHALRLTPGDVRTARSLLYLLNKAVPSVSDICGNGGQESDTWPGCPYANTSHYAEGGKNLIPRSNEEELHKTKVDSVARIAAADVLKVRPHHFMCITCFLGRGLRGPIQEDNLFEVWDRIAKRPDIPVELVEGCCMVCPPCDGYLLENNSCLRPCGLRDRKKDLDVLRKLNLAPSAVLPAREFFSRLFQHFPTQEEICAQGDEDSAAEWCSCGSAHSKCYVNGRDYIISTLFPTRMEDIVV